MEDLIMPYTGVDLTREVNRLPNKYGLLNALNLAPFEPKRSKFVRLDIKDGVIHVLAARERGEPGQTGAKGKEKGIIIEIPHFPFLEQILVDDVDSLVEVLNGQMEPRSLDREILKKLLSIRSNHSITLEFLRLGMLRGEILDGEGTTLLDLFDAFDITKKRVNFELSKEDTNVRAKCEQVIDHIQSNLKGETSTGVENICSPDFFEKLISHPKVEKFWLQAQNSSEHRELTRSMMGGNYGRVFEFGGILWREYKGSLPVKDEEGNITSVPNIASKKGHAYPTGTQNMMRTYESAAYHMDHINEIPAEDTILISIERLKHGKGFELETQSNRIAVSKQPECLVETYTT
jgi:hypothetical protein